MARYFDRTQTRWAGIFPKKEGKISGLPNLFDFLRAVFYTVYSIPRDFLDIPKVRAQKRVPKPEQPLNESETTVKSVLEDIARKGSSASHEPIAPPVVGDEPPVFGSSAPGLESPGVNWHNPSNSERAAVEEADRQRSASIGASGEAIPERLRAQNEAALRDTSSEITPASYRDEQAAFDKEFQRKFENKKGDMLVVEEPLSPSRASESTQEQVERMRNQSLVIKDKKSPPEKQGLFHSLKDMLKKDPKGISGTPEAVISENKSPKGTPGKKG